MDAGAVAVVGISGVGKEYIRELIKAKKRIVLVDFWPVLNGQITWDSLGLGKLSNTFPGHEFNVFLPQDTSFVTPDVENLADALRASGVTHVIHATPPTEQGRSVLTQTHDSFEHLVEKPYFSQQELGPNVHVAYMYAYLGTEFDVLRSVHQPGWRADMPNPLIWDLGSHVLSMHTPTSVDAYWISEDAVLLSSFRWKALIQYDDSRIPVFLRGGLSVVDWDWYFQKQLRAFLTGASPTPLPSTGQAIQYEDEIRRIEAKWLNRSS